MKRGHEKAKAERVHQKIGRDAEKLNTILVDNFVSLQKAITNLAEKFDSLSSHISSLLQLFEFSAKSFADKMATSVPEVEKDREFLEKLNRLLEQNKVIAKGLTLMEEKLRERLYGHPTMQKQEPKFMPAQSFPSFPSVTEEGYIPSSLEEKSKFREE